MVGGNKPFGVHSSDAIFPQIKATATIILRCQSPAATIQGWPQFEGSYYYTSAHALVLIW